MALIEKLPKKILIVIQRNNTEKKEKRKKNLKFYILYLIKSMYKDKIIYENFRIQN